MQGRLFIQGVGTATPKLSLTAEESARLFEQACRTPATARLYRRVSRLTGIEKRHLAVLDSMAGESPLYRPIGGQPHGPGMTARSALFDDAAGQLVEEVVGSFAPEQLGRVGVLVTASCTHASSPGLEQAVFERTAVRAAVQRWNLGFMGCSAGLSGLRLVHEQRGSAGVTDAGGAHLSMIVACELSSLHFQYSEELDQMTANMLFADGAAAVLASGARSPVEVLDCRCATIPAFCEQMVWKAGDYGLELRLSQELPETLAAHLPAAVGAFLDRSKLKRGHVEHWLVHPGGPQILDQVEKCLGLGAASLELSRGVLQRYGNMSSPTIFFILKDLLASGMTGRAVLLAFGPGLTIEMALLELSAR